jgi:hypothetical protein
MVLEFPPQWSRNDEWVQGNYISDFSELMHELLLSPHWSLWMIGVTSQGCQE